MERIIYPTEVLCATCNARLFSAVQKGLSGQNSLNVIGAYHCLGLACKNGVILNLMSDRGGVVF